MTDAVTDYFRGKKGAGDIELFTFSTPNGLKVSVLLEELKEAYGLSYKVTPVNIMAGEQKAAWYTQLNPNGRIPTIVDHSRGGFVVFETSAILAYLTRHYDPEHKFSYPHDSDEQSVAEQWVAWEHGGLGPIQAQAIFYLRFSLDRETPAAVSRYLTETEKLYGILEARLAGGREFVAGPGRGRFGVADMAIVGWANMTTAITIDLRTRFPAVHAWFDRVLARPAVQRGLAVPRPAPFGNLVLEKQLAAAGPDDAVRRREESVQRMMEQAMEQSGYKLSPEKVGARWVKV